MLHKSMRCFQACLFFGVANYAQSPQVAALWRATKHLGYFVVYLKAAIKQLVALPRAVIFVVDSTSMFATLARVKSTNLLKFCSTSFWICKKP